MPYKIIIVDDEDVVREGLANFVDWQSMGFEVAARLDDGKQALEYIEKMPVDVILTDIKMTFISGLDLAKYIFENRPDIKVVLISGYKEFDFAIQAVNYKVEHYLLKPTSFEEVTRVFKQVKAQLDKEREEEKKLQEERSRYEEIIPLLQEQFFTDIIMGAICDKQEIKRRIRLCRIDIDPELNMCGLILLKLVGFDEYIHDKWEYGKDGFYTAVRSFVQTEGHGVRYFPVYNIHDSIQVLAIAVHAMDEATFRQTIEDNFESIKQGVKAVFGVDTTAHIQYHIQHIFTNLLELAVSSKPLLSAYMDDTSDYNVNELLEKQKLLVSYIEAGNLDGVINLFNSFLNGMKAMDIRRLHNFVIELLVTICAKLKDVGIDVYALTQGGFNYDDILLLDDVEGIRSWGQVALREIVKLVEQCKETPKQNIINAAKKYINSNYCKDISLEDVADHVFLNPIYFSRFFKQQTGENFSDYLVKVRMEAAKEKLKDPRLKIYEVSDMVGYKSTRYFSKLFKEYTGFTPSEFRSNVLTEKMNAYEG